MVSQHVYHETCIIPWLELHGTCPICRKSLAPEQQPDEQRGLAAAANAVANTLSKFRSPSRMFECPTVRLCVCPPQDLFTPMRSPAPARASRPRRPWTRVAPPRLVYTLISESHCFRLQRVRRPAIPTVRRRPARLPVAGRRRPAVIAEREVAELRDRQTAGIGMTMATSITSLTRDPDSARSCVCARACE